MNANKWFSDILNAKKTCFVEGNCKKVHYLFEDHREMVEEYNLATNVVTKRAWKVTNSLSKVDEWEIEIGDPDFKPNTEKVIIREGRDQPYVTKRVTKRNIEWRIHNLPYPKDTYSVSIDPNDKCIVVRTSNKKYYKKLIVTELERVGLVPEDQNVQFTHQLNTLIITYTKPKEVLDLDKAILNEIKDLKPSLDGKMDCKPS